MAAICFADSRSVSMNWAWFGGIVVNDRSQSVPVTNGLPVENAATARSRTRADWSGSSWMRLFFKCAGGRPPPRRMSAYSCADSPARTIAAWCSIGDMPSVQPMGTIHGMWKIFDDGTGAPPTYHCFAVSSNDHDSRRSHDTTDG